MVVCLAYRHSLGIVILRGGSRGRVQGVPNPPPNLVPRAFPIEFGNEVVRVLRFRNYL